MVERDKRPLIYSMYNKAGQGKAVISPKSPRVRLFLEPFLFGIMLYDASRGKQ